MLPLANTFCDTIFLLGCDGKRPDKNNEDFWAHAETAQYQNMVITGHQCHPTFDVHRQKSTYGRYNDSVFHSINIGETQYGKKYYTLEKSNILGLENRLVPQSLNYELNSAGEIILSTLMKGASYDV